MEMNILHILNDGLNEDAKTIIDSQSRDHDIEIIDLTEADLDYELLVESIEQCDKVFSW